MESQNRQIPHHPEQTADQIESSWKKGEIVLLKLVTMFPYGMFPYHTFILPFGFMWIYFHVAYMLGLASLFIYYFKKKKKICKINISKKNLDINY